MYHLYPTPLDTLVLYRAEASQFDIFFIPYMSFQKDLLKIILSLSAQSTCPLLYLNQIIRERWQLQSDGDNDGDGDGDGDSDGDGDRLN